MDTLRSYLETLTHDLVTGLGGLDLKKYLHTTRSLSPCFETRAISLVLSTGTMATKAVLASSLSWTGEQRLGGVLVFQVSVAQRENLLVLADVDQC